MADTPRTLAALQALLADNTSGSIDAQDVRDFLVSCGLITGSGELGGTADVPTVTTVHSGSSHAATQAAAEATAAAALAGHEGDTSDAHDASAISILDAANDFTATDVEGALAELQADAEFNAALITTHASAPDPHSYVLESLIDAIGDLIVGAADNTPAKLAKPATSEQSVTTPSSFSTANWGSQTANARKTLVVDPSTGQLTWDFIYATDINTPTQVTAFTATPAGGSSSLGLVASSGTDIPAFAMTYQGTPTAVTIDIQSETYAGSPEVVGSDYPATVITPFASLSGPAINRGTAVGETVTFRVTATIAGASRTKDVTVTYINYRYYGVSTNAAIDTDGEIDTFASTQTNSLVNSLSASFTVTAGANEYIYFMHRTALGTPTFTVGGFAGGFSLVGNDVVHTNSRGFSETFDVYRSDNHSLGSTTVTVT